MTHDPALPSADTINVVYVFSGSGYTFASCVPKHVRLGVFLFFLRLFRPSFCLLNLFICFVLGYHIRWQNKAV